MAFSPDGKLIASGSDDYTIRIWNVDTDVSSKILQGHKNLVRSVTFSPDGKLIASGSNDHTVKIWDVSTGECMIFTVKLPETTLEFRIVLSCDWKFYPS